ncbi:MAG: hypothetical protein ACD_47C00517G0001 [uncultured bacterium]|nr:MAG: hypothetical protein ACD_47C00517G0001 [uncultured bacterium]
MSGSLFEYARTTGAVELSIASAMTASWRGSSLFAELSEKKTSNAITFAPLRERISISRAYMRRFQGHFMSSLAKESSSILTTAIFFDAGVNTLTAPILILKS